MNVWTVDARGTLSSTRQYRKKGEITCVVFCTITPRGSNDAQRGKDWKKNYSPSFFIGTEKGTIFYADDLGHCADVQQVTSPIDKMLFYEDMGRLVILTKSLMLTQYQVGEDGKVSRLNQVKISVPKDVADNGLKSLVWAGAGILAAATQEKIIRLLNLSTDENYNISLSGLGDIFDRADCASAVCFNPIDRYLAIGTEGGVIAMYKFCGVSKKTDGDVESASNSGSASDWEVMILREIDINS